MPSKLQSSVLRATALALGCFAFAAPVFSAPKQTGVEIVVTVLTINPLDRADDLSNGDFFARVTVNNEAAQTSAVLSKPGLLKPNWKLVQKVSPGLHKVKIELVDKDVSADDPIDINRVDKKRDLEFTVDTRSCKIDGFSQPFKCGSVIRRAGTETKKAEISFSVSVKRR